MSIFKKKKEEYAEPINFPIIMDTGAPDPRVICNGHKTFVIFYVRDDFNPFTQEPASETMQLSPENKEERIPEAFVLVKFNHCLIHKFGTPNDEVLNGHRLRKKGLSFYSWHKVHNSSWIEEIKNVNRVHPKFSEKHWLNLNHYIITFHNETFECVAESYELITIDTLENLLTQTLKII